MDPNAPNNISTRVTTIFPMAAAAAAAATTTTTGAAATATSAAGGFSTAICANGGKPATYQYG